MGVTIQHSHEPAIQRANKAALAESLQKPAIEPFEYHCWRHTCGTRWAEAGMDKYMKDDLERETLLGMP